jgi:hypothetical protein
MAEMGYAVAAQDFFKQLRTSEKNVTADKQICNCGAIFLLQSGGLGVADGREKL